MNSITKRLIFLEETISDPLGFTQKTLEELKNSCGDLLNEINNYHSKNLFNQNVKLFYFLEDESNFFFSFGKISNLN